MNDPNFFDDIYMRRAEQLALRGLGRVSPNPAVGAVVVKDQEIVGEGFHAEAGAPHAEVLALEQAGEEARGATLYVTLEPCCHEGRTPPCCPTVIESGVTRVVVGWVDPDPRVRGAGNRALRAAGIQVDMASPDQQKQCAETNRFFLSRVENGRPFVTFKYAMTLDGKLATHTGDSQWITGEAARRWVHTQRAIYDAVMVGIGTVLADDPQLTPREPPGRTPIKIVVDSSGRLKPEHRIFEDASAGVWVLTTEAAAPRFEGLSVFTIICGDGEAVDLASGLKQCAELGLNSIFVEGGSALFGSLFEKKLFDQVAAFISPAMIGGGGPSPVGGTGFEKMSHALQLKDVHWSQLGTDILLEGYRQLPWEIGEPCSGS